MGSLRAKIDYIVKHNRVVYHLFFSAGSWFFRILGLFIPLKKKRVLFTAHGRLYNDSPRAIYEYLISHSEYDDYELIWGVENPEKVRIPGRAKKIQIDTIKYFVTALSSEYWITCVNIERGLKFKKRKTKFLNTWHGFPTKGVSQDDPRQTEDLSHIDYYCAAGDYDREFYHKLFMIPYDHFLMCGFPRMDTLYNLKPDEKEEIKKKLGLPLDKKVIMYGPTWRESTNSGNSYDLRPPVDLKKWEKALSNEYVLMMRLHPYTKNLMGVDFNDFVRDYSSYANVNDLLKVTDILISDYSGMFFEYAALERPIICFGYDIENYKKERGLVIDLEREMPNGVLRTEDVVIKHILTMDYDEECLKTKKLKEKYLTYGGNATKICIDALFS